MVERFGGKVRHAGSLPHYTQSKRFSLKRRFLNDVRCVVAVLVNVLCERLQKKFIVRSALVSREATDMYERDQKILAQQCYNQFAGIKSFMTIGCDEGPTRETLQIFKFLS
jgi:hypothetical protein